MTPPLKEMDGDVTLDGEGAADAGNAAPSRGL